MISYKLIDCYILNYFTLLYWNLLHVQNSIGNWRRKQEDVPIDIQPQKGIPKIIDFSSTLANWWLLLVHA